MQAQCRRPSTLSRFLGQLQVWAGRYFLANTAHTAQAQNQQRATCSPKQHTMSKHKINNDQHVMAPSMQHLKEHYEDLREACDGKPICHTAVAARFQFEQPFPEGAVPADRIEEFKNESDPAKRHAIACASVDGWARDLLIILLRFIISFGAEPPEEGPAAAMDIACHAFGRDMTNDSEYGAVAGAQVPAWRPTHYLPVF